MDNRLVVAVALAAGLAGGMLTRYIAPPPVFAQGEQCSGAGCASSGAPTPAIKELRARSFVLVDEFNNTLGTFTAEPFAGNYSRTSPSQPPTLRPGTPVRIFLKDAGGNVTWSAGGSNVRPLSATVR